MSAILSYASVTHRYRPGERPAVDGVSLEVQAGRVVALVGPNGSGKSTLLRLALDGKPTAGEVAWHNRPLAKWDRGELARQVAFLPQSPSALPGQTVTDVIASGRAPHWGAFGSESSSDRQLAEAAAVRFNVAQWNSRPIDTLSGGERGRVFLARSYAQVSGAARPTLLLDEPDAALDLARSADLGRLLREISGNGVTVVLATHDLNLAAGVADEIALMSNGRLVASGTPGEVLTETRVSDVYGISVRRLEVEGQLVLVAR